MVSRERPSFLCPPPPPPSPSFLLPPIPSLPPPPPFPPSFFFFSFTDSPLFFSLLRIVLPSQASVVLSTLQQESRLRGKAIIDVSHHTGAAGGWITERVTYIKPRSPESTNDEEENPAAQTDASTASTSTSTSTSTIVVNLGSGGGGGGLNGVGAGTGTGAMEVDGDGEEEGSP